MLDNLKDLIEAFLSNTDIFARKPIVAGDLYCPSCGGTRRMVITPISMPSELYNPHMQSYYQLVDNEEIIPALFIFRCVQCETKFTAIIYKGPDGASLALLPSCRGGLTTPHTPPGVAYYLDQAHKAQSVGANSATIAMFRGALEHLLFQQGYKMAMLGQKINKLCEDIDKGKGPKWAKELNTDFLNVIKDLGNASIHPNDGNVENQKKLDNKLIDMVKELFLELLLIVYEYPLQKDERLKTLRAKAQLFKK